MSANYTPGPWRVVEVFRASGGRDLSIEAENEVLCCIPVSSGTEQADFANARLMAAAPEMAELLGLWVNGAGGPPDYDAKAAARDLLDRIEGGE